MTSDNQYKGYTPIITYSEEDGCYIGRVADLETIITFDGEDEAQALAAFQEAIDFYLDTESEPERPFSRFTVKLPAEISDILRQKGGPEEWNSFIISTLKQAVHHI